MNTKNIILGLSLILSSVATLNLTSCCDDDDDDANHAPKSVQVDQQKAEQKKADSLKVEKQKAEQRKADSLKAEQKKADEAKVKEETAKQNDYSVSPQFEADIKNYVADMFRGQIKKLTVGVSEKYIIISFYAYKSEVESVNSKLNEATQSNGKLTSMIKATCPNAKIYGSGNAPTGKTSYFLLTYKK